ncbi:MAG: coenzyme F420-0:L-glutamate ligase [Candidatus Thorarchaeota archaeon]|nr:coenzyme F420-0:L-glutamate ligase [Candidatus Thorarchaeota archaeon]
MTSNNIEIIPLHGIPLVSEGEDISSLILRAVQENKFKLQAGDIIVIAHTLISKAEGRVVDGSKVSVSDEAQKIADENDFDPIQVEIALQESKLVLRSKRALITQLEDGHICNFSGVDRSNAPEGKFVLLPSDADQSATSIREALSDSTGKELAVIISDTEGRPWRKGAINLAVGCAGINAFKYNEGKKDLYGRTLQHSLVCQIDQVASAAEMVMGQANEGLPVVIVRGYDYEKGEENAKTVHRTTDENLFK